MRTNRPNHPVRFPRATDARSRGLRFIRRSSILPCRIGPEITFVETRVFTRRIVALGLEDALRDLQLMLLDRPEAGDLDPGTGGLRKVRVRDPKRGKGKRGGARVHYLWLSHRSVIYLMFVYGKDEIATLSADQKRELRQVVEAIKREWASKA